MPYIIERRRRVYLPTEPGASPMWRDESDEPHAVASMGEVHSDILTELSDRDHITGPEDELCSAVLDLSEASGGTIGPLPDGSSIDVHAVTWRELAKLTGDEHNYRRDELCPDTCDSFISAYNGERGD